MDATADQLGQGAAPGGGAAGGSGLAAPAPKLQLVLCVHTMEVATAKVPFSMILLMDHIRTKRSLPDDMRCRMVIPSDGLVSVSLWDCADPQALRQWLDDNLGSDCISQVCEVQEEFTYGVALELARARGADRVGAGSRRAVETLSAGVSAASTRLQEWDRQTGVITTASTVARETTAKLSSAVAKAAESERVQSVAAAASAAAAAGWKKVSDLTGWGNRRTNEAAGEPGAALVGGGGGADGHYQGGQLPPYSSGGGAGGGGSAGGAVGAGSGAAYASGAAFRPAADDLDRKLSPSDFDGPDDAFGGHAATSGGGGGVSGGGVGLGGVGIGGGAPPAPGSGGGAGAPQPGH